MMAIFKNVLHTGQTETSCHTFCSISQGNSQGLLFSRDAKKKSRIHLHPFVPGEERSMLNIIAQTGKLI